MTARLTICESQIALRYCCTATFTVRFIDSTHTAVRINSYIKSFVFTIKLSGLKSPSSPLVTNGLINVFFKKREILKRTFGRPSPNSQFPIPPIHSKNSSSSHFMASDEVHSVTFSKTKNQINSIEKRQNLVIPVPFTS